MNFFKSKKKDELVLVFDIGSSMVGGAFFFLRDSGAPKIVYSVFEPIPLAKEIDPERLFDQMIKALKVIAGKMCMSGVGSPARIYAILSSPWYASQTRVIKFEKNTPFVFNEKLANSLIEKEIKLFEEEHSAKDQKSVGKIRPLEMKSMETTLNGYATRSPIGQKARELEMMIFVSMGEDYVLSAIEKAINQHFHDRKINFVSFVMASFVVARDMFVNQDDFLLINIGGEVTDISMIKKEVLRDSISFPMGRNFMIRGVAEATGSSLDEALSFISVFKEGHLSETAHKKAEAVIAKLKIDWLHKLHESLNNLSNEISIPATIFITVDPQFSKFFSEIIKTEQFSQYTLTESKYRIIFLGTEALHGIAEFEEKIHRDPFLIIESIYINHFLK